MGDTVEYAASAAECAGQANVLVVAVPWQEFRDLKPSDLLQSDGRPTIVDCWRFLNADDFADHADYVALGVGPAVGVEVKVG